MICQKVNLLCPSNGTPGHIVLSATGQKSAIELIPKSGRTEIAEAINTIIIQGDAILANLETCSKPNMATTVVMIPIKNTAITQPTLLGYMSFNDGMIILKGMPTAVADTAIMEPAKKQNNPAFTRLYISEKFEPPIFCSW